MKRQVFEFDAVPVKIVDADTIDFEIDLGFGITISRRIRLISEAGLYVDAWEVRGPERERGLAAKAYVADKLLTGMPDILLKTTLEHGKFGRVLASVRVAPRGLEGWDLADGLWEHGHLKRLGDVRLLHETAPPPTPPRIE
jgi:hypothetical protein